MTSSRPNLTDALLQRALTELAAGPDASSLLADVLRTVDGKPQAVPSLWPAHFGWRQVALVAVTGVLLITLIGVVALLSGVLPDPGPPPSRADAFVRPFEYRLPPAGSMALVSSAPHMYRFEGADGGVAVFEATDAAVHPCPVPNEGPSRVTVRSTPETFFIDLAALGGIGTGRVLPTTIDGVAGTQSDIDPDSHLCSDRDIHFARAGLDFIDLDSPGRLAVVDIDGALIGVWVWATDGSLLGTWHTTAAEFLDSVHFYSSGPVDPSPSVAPSPAAEPGAPRLVEDFARPFTYTFPPGETLSLVSRSHSTPMSLYTMRGVGYGVEVFVVEGIIHPCVALFPAPTPQPGGGQTPFDTITISSSPEGFLQALHDVAGVGIGPISATSVDGFEAFTAEIDPARSECSGTTIHAQGSGLSYAGFEPELDTPAKIWVVDVDSVSIGIRAWAKDTETFAEWLPRAAEFVENINFTGQP